MTRAVLILALLILALAAVRDARATDGQLTGYASAYADGVMADVIRLRFERGYWPNTPRRDWYISHGAIAVLDCSQVGTMATLTDPAGREYRVLVADCGERGKPGEGGDWMEQNNIIVELDWRLWERLTTEHGRPLEVSLK